MTRTTAEIGETANALRHAVSRLSRRLRQMRPESTHSPGKLSALALLFRTGAPMTIGELARRERLQPQTLTRIVADLESEGLIERSVDPEDRRQMLLSVTDAGRALLYDYARRQNAWLDEALQTFSETECGIIALATSLLDRIADIE